MPCPHDLAERETAVADGYCPICLAAQMDKLEKAREAFLNLIADAVDYEYNPDGDVTDSGYPIDCSTFKIVTRRSQMDELVEALGIPRRFDEDVADAIDRAIDAAAEAADPNLVK